MTTFSIIFTFILGLVISVFGFIWYSEDAMKSLLAALCGICIMMLAVFVADENHEREVVLPLKAMFPDCIYDSLYTKTKIILECGDTIKFITKDEFKQKRDLMKGN